MIKKVTFGAGCFWHVQDEFSKLDGVINTTVGYIGGTLKNPTYKQVCSHKTGHAEVTLVEYDPKKISFKKLLETFWSIHDPTQLNRQGPDLGDQYRSAIFYYDEEQKKEAEASLKKKQKEYKQKIVTKIEKAEEFWKAEEYHQNYFKKTGKRVCGF